MDSRCDYHSHIVELALCDRPVLVFIENISVEERIAKRKAQFPSGGLWGVLRTYLGLVVGGSSRDMPSVYFARSDDDEDTEYLNAVSAASLGSAIEAAMNLMPDPLAEEVLVLLGGMSPRFTGSGERCLAAPRGTVSSLRKLQRQIITDHSN